jgi:hypothetical protein
MTPTPFLNTRKLRLPGRAGELQDVGATASLVRELGDNYSTYHQHLATELARLGGRPDPADYRDDFEGYCEAYSAARDVVLAEVALRSARAFRKLGGHLADPPPLDEPPLVDRNDRLVSVEP